MDRHDAPRPFSFQPRLSRARLALAFSVAALSDGLSIVLAPTPPAQWSADLATALVLFAVLGWRWILLPALIMEAIPGLYVFPFWVFVVGAVAMGDSTGPAGRGSGSPRGQ